MKNPDGEWRLKMKNEEDRWRIKNTDKEWRIEMKNEEDRSRSKYRSSVKNRYKD